MRSKPREARFTRRLLSGMIVLNLVTVIGFFILPRANFMMRHWNEPRLEVQQKSGTYDLPNLYFQTYRTVPEILERVPEKATLLMPPRAMPGMFHSAAQQILFPRKLYFEGEEGFQRMMDAALLVPDLWKVNAPEDPLEACPENLAIPLGESGFSLCRLDH